MMVNGGLSIFPISNAEQCGEIKLDVRHVRKATRKSRPPVVIFFAHNGKGVGHVTRLLAIDTARFAQHSIVRSKDTDFCTRQFIVEVTYSLCGTGYASIESGRICNTLGEGFVGTEHSLVWLL